MGRILKGQEVLRRGVSVWLVLMAILPHSDESTVITAENVQLLKSDVVMDFRVLHALTTGSGIFVMNNDASLVVSFATEGNAPPLSTAVVWDGTTGEFIKALRLESNFYDRTLTPDDETLLVATENGVTGYQLLNGLSSEILTVTDGPVVEVWVNEKNEVCAETFPLEGSQVICENWDAPIPLFDGNMNDSRIGRVLPPFAVTTTEAGNVTLWDMETNETLANTQVEDVAVFGAINASATHLAWRNPDSTELHLLAFETGEDEVIAPLSGAFIAYLLLAPNADIIFGIDPMDARSEVVAWITETGEQLSLGKYRACNRQQPDLAQLSEDGTALVIGCDAGLDVWRIQGD